VTFGLLETIIFQALQGSSPSVWQISITDSPTSCEEKFFQGFRLARGGLIRRGITKGDIMGVSGTFICKKCQNHFKASLGGSVQNQLIRCENCDATKFVPRLVPPRKESRWLEEDEPMPEAQNLKEEATHQREKLAYDAELALRCKSCDGRMRDDLPPKCPNCGARDAELDRRFGVLRYD
jgi:Zn finger protein HypA/HybF involved in hydrogenase expression